MKSEIIIETGFVCDVDGNRHIVYLSGTGDILTTGHCEELFKAAALLFYRDIAGKVAVYGDFIKYGLGDYPVSYDASSHKYNGFEKLKFEARLSILTKENYETILDVVNNS